MNNEYDIEIKFKTRGDDIDMLNQAILSVSHDNEMLAGYLCYLKVEIVEQLDKLGFNIPKEEFPIGSEKGYTWDEVEKFL